MMDMRITPLKQHLAALALLVFLGFEGGAKATVIEGFESGGLSGYSNYGAAHPTAVGSAYAHDGNYGLCLLPALGGGWLYRNDAAVNVHQGQTISWWVKFSNLYYTRAWLSFGASSSGALSLVLGPTYGQLLFQEGYHYRDLSVVPQSYLADHWYYAEVDWQIGGGLVGRLYDSDGVTLLNSLTASSTAYTSGGIGFNAYDQAGTGVSFDTVSVSAIPEPAALALFVSGVWVLIIPLRRNASGVANVQ